MSLDRFENKDEVIGVSPAFGKTMFADEEPRIEKFNDAITQNDIDGTYSGINTTNASEIHIYAEDNLIESLYGQPIRSTLTNGKPTVFVVPELDLRQAGVEEGAYSVLYNFHHNVVSNLKVGAISGDRTEVRLVSKTNTPNVFQNLSTFNQIFGSNSFDAFLRKKDFVLNFSNNAIYDVINLQFDGPRVGELTGTLSYPTGVFNGTPTIFVPLDDVVSALGIWRTFIEVYRPAINQPTPLLGEPTGRFRKYELQQNTNGTLKWNSGPNTFVSPDIPSDVPSDIQSFVKDNSITEKRFQIDETKLNLNYKWYNNQPSELNTVIVRLLKPLEGSVEVGDTLGIDARTLKSWVDKVIAFPAIDVVDKDDFSTPNFAVEMESYGKSDGTDFKTWNDLLDANLSTSQQIIDYYFSGSLGKIKLNIQYNDFQNYIHFSSATERVENFVYKLQQIEAYNSRIDLLTGVSGAAALTNISQSISRRDKIVGAFDGFEYWMYYQDTSSIYTHWSSSDYTITPYPKVSTFPYVLQPLASSQAQSWYAGVQSSASLYDSQNAARLRNMIPVHLQEDDKNSDYITFIDMIGQHFDISWTYVKALTDINRREEHPWDGMSDDLLFNVAKSMGWSLSNGYGDSDLWTYVLGTDQTGSLAQTGLLKTKSREKIVKETWRRIVNNLPYIYKTKGTPRSIKALLATYGIPQAFLQIREYGGPTIVDVPNQYEHERFVYKVNIDAQAGKYIVNPWDEIDPEGIYTARFPRAIEVIAKLPASIGSDDGGVTGEYTIFDMVVPGERISVKFNGVNSTTANFTLVSGSTSLLTTNNFTWNGSRDVVIVLNNDSTNTSLRAAMPDNFGSILASVSASGATPLAVDNVWLDDGVLNVGSPTDNNYTSFNLQELRYYYNTISQEIVEDHAKNRDAYFIDDNTTDLNTTGSLVTLLYRQFFDSRYGGSNWNSASLHPNQEITQTVNGYPLTASFGGSVSSADLEGELDTYYSKIPSAGALNVNNNKIRIESSSLAGVLSPDKSQENSQYDYAPLDSNLVGVYFSTTDTVNYDIYNSEGYFEIDDWVGDTDERYNESYPLLRYRSQNYFAKYTTKTALNLILSLLARYDSSIFTQIKQVLPARVNYMSGILIEPHILERNKYKRNRGITRDYHQYVGTIPMYSEANITASRNDYGFSSGSGIVNDGAIDLYNYLPSTYQYQIATLSSSISCSISSVNTEVSMSFTTDISSNDRVLSIDSVILNNAADYEFYNGNAFYVYEVGGNLVFNQVSNPGNTSAYGLLEVGTPISNGSQQITLDPDWEVTNTTSAVNFKLVANNTLADPWDTFTSSSSEQICITLPSTYVNRTNGYWEYSPTASQAVNARTTSQAFIVNRFFSTAGSASRNEAFSSSLSPADVQEYRGLSIENLYFNGCRITSDSLTTDSTDTPDGGPVIEVNLVDSNTLVLSTKTALDGDLRIGSAEPIQTMVPTELISLQNYEESISQTSTQKRNDIDTEQAVLNAPLIYTIPSRPLYRDAVSTQQQVAGNVTIQTNFIQPRNG